MVIKNQAEATTTAAHPSSSSSFSSTPSPDRSPPSSTVFSDTEQADEVDDLDVEMMDPEEDKILPRSRPQSYARSASPSNSVPAASISVPHVPTLKEILENSSPPPWTLSAFTAYLSQNHCLENLEFIKEAESYGTQYREVAASGSKEPSDELCWQWKRILNTYIVPDTPREINIPSEVRESLLSMPCETAPPKPEALEHAIKLIFDLINDSILMAFINEVSPNTNRSPPSISEEREYSMCEERLSVRKTSDDGSVRDRSRSRRTPPPAPSAKESSLLSKASILRTGSLRHASHRSSGTAARSTAKQLALQHNSMPANAYVSEQVFLTDDSSSLPSPTQSPTTPPPGTGSTATPISSTSTPSGDLGATSPKRSGDNAWRKMMGRLGSKRARPSGSSSRSRPPADRSSMESRHSSSHQS